MFEQKNFANFHVLISHSPSCLNRDDQNMQKRAVFGGVDRIRISSQSLKRAIRQSDYHKDNLGEPSIRSNKLDKLIQRFCEKLKNKHAIKLIKKTIEWMSGKEGITENVEVDSVAPWAIAEVDMFCEKVKEAESRKIDAEKLKKQIEKDASPFRKNFEQAIDIALSGRMATFGLMNAVPVDGSLAVAHAITTHAAQADIDWFTAVDDLVQESGEVGAAHLATQEFSSGVFYRYASLNLKQLQFNLGLISDIKENGTAESRKRTLEIAKHVFHMLCTVVPSAKQQSFAAHNLADFAIVMLDDQPISLANAFEKPIEKEKNGGYLKPSVSALADYFSYMKKVYGFNGLVVGTPEDIDAIIPSDLTMLTSFPAVEEWITKDGKIS